MNGVRRPFELAKAAMRAAKSRGVLVSLDLASFEVVRNCRSQLLEILESGVVDLLFANEDEAEELMRLDAAAAADDDAAPAGAEESEEGQQGEGGGGYKAAAPPGELFTRKDADRAMAWMLRYCKVRRCTLSSCLTHELERRTVSNS